MHRFWVKPSWKNDNLNRKGTDGFPGYHGQFSHDTTAAARTLGLRVGTFATLRSGLEPPVEPSSLGPTSNGGCILVIDDEATIRKMVSDVLVSEGYLVWPAKHGAEALAVLDRARPSPAILACACQF